MLGSGYPNSLNHLALLVLPLLTLTYPTNASRTSNTLPNIAEPAASKIVRLSALTEFVFPWQRETTNMIKYSAEREEKQGGCKKLWCEDGKRGGLGRIC